MVDVKPEIKKTVSNRKNNIYKIVLTGGPCAGKTTSMTQISDRLRERGYRVYNVPECACLVATGGGLINIMKMTIEENIKFQSALTQYIMNQEDRFAEIAALGDANEPAVILCDRGTYDNRAYCPAESWEAVLDEKGWKETDIRDKRYDGVVHLVTAADGAEKFYTLENNAARYETAEQARELDLKLKNAWLGHPSHFIVDNNNVNFEGKINKAYQSILQILGIGDDVPKKFNRFLLESKDPKNPVPSLPEGTQQYAISDTFLVSTGDNLENRVRRRAQGKNAFYEHVHVTYSRSLTDKDFKGDGVEKKQQITAREYLAMVANKDKDRSTLEKLRQIILHEGKMFMIDTFLNIKKPFSIIYLDSKVDITKCTLPEGLKVERDVSDDIAFHSYTVAKDVDPDFKK